ncbi:MAG: hypothetical protein IJN04_04835 [Clostridia bacterium]|nr:hypothetical protein [Clostridia bacterium]
MLMKIYGNAFKVLMKKPLKLWGISLLSIALSGVLGGLCGFAIPGLAVCVGLLMGTSMTIIYLKGYRGEEVSTPDLFYCFKDWNTIKRVLLGMGWMALWIFIWSLIPIVGPIFAIIRTYEYRLTPYILVFEPEVPITEAIKISSQKTNGYKGQMFLAELLFGLILVVGSIILALIPVLGWIAILVASALAPLFLGLVQAAFYEEINGVSTVFCANCGQPMAGDAQFCANCGTPVHNG